MELTKKGPPKILSNFREVLIKIGPTLDTNSTQELQAICDGLEERENDHRVAAEIGQLLLEKNKQLTEELADLTLTTKQKLDRKDAELSALQTRNKDAVKRLEDFQSKANEEISALETKCEEFRLQARDNSQLREKNRKLLEELDTVQIQLQTANETITELRKANARLVAERGRNSSLGDKEDSSLRADYEHLKVQLASMQHLETSNKKLHKELNELKMANVDLQRTIGEHDQMAEVLSSLVKANRAMQAKDEESAAMIANLRAEISQLKASLEEQQLLSSSHIRPPIPASDSSGAIPSAVPASTSQPLSFDDELRQLQDAEAGSLAAELQQARKEEDHPATAAEVFLRKRADTLAAAEAATAAAAAAAAASNAAPAPGSSPVATTAALKRLQEKRKLQEAKVQLQNQHAELLAATQALEAELAEDRKKLDAFQKKVDTLNKQITASDEYVEPNLTAESKDLLARTQELLAKELAATLEAFSASENTWQEKQQLLQFNKEKLLSLEEKLAKLQAALEDDLDDFAFSEQLLLDENKEDLVRELIRLRSVTKRQKTDEEVFLTKVNDLRKRLNESDVQRMSSLIKNMMSLKELLQISNISIESVMRDIKNLNVPRDKRLMFQATDLLLECAFLRQRNNEHNEATIIAQSREIVPKPKPDASRTPPVTPVKKGTDPKRDTGSSRSTPAPAQDKTSSASVSAGASPVASAEGAPPPSSPFKKVLSIFK